MCTHLKDSFKIENAYLIFGNVRVYRRANINELQANITFFITFLLLFVHVKSYKKWYQNTSLFGI